MRLGCVSGVLWYAVQEQAGRDPFEVVLEEAGRLGLAGLCGQPERWQETGDITRVAGMAADLGITVEPTWADRFADPDLGTVRPADAFRVWLKQVCVPFGAPIAGVVVRGAHRFLRQPPLETQLALIAERLRPLAEVAADFGVRLAIENHADYRAPEIARIVQQVDRPSFGVRLDTGNPLTIGEEPVDAARVLAPYTITTHFKDMYVYPVGRSGGPGIPHQTGAPLGRGAVDLPAIIALLRAHTPGVVELPLNIEIDWRPREEDGRVWAETSIRYCRETFGAVLSSGGGAAPAWVA